MPAVLIIAFMRLQKSDIAAIVTTVCNTLPAVEQFFLFGSRCAAERSGGDIDLFVRSAERVSLEQKLQVLVVLERAGIIRKVDLAIESPEQPQAKLRAEVEQKGVQLW